MTEKSPNKTWNAVCDTQTVMKSSVASIFAGLALLFVAPAYADALRLTHSGNDTDVVVGDGATVILNGSGNSGNFSFGLATGEAAKIYAQSQRNSPPPAPKRIEIRKGGVLLGGMTEIIPGSDVFVGARHVLQDNSSAELVAAGLDPTKYNFYQFKRNGSIEDAVIAIPRGRESSVLDFTIDLSCNCNGGFKLKLRDLPEVERTVSVGDQYFSYQYGTVGREDVSQASHGTISRVGTDHYFLDLNNGNNTTARSSGSVVQIQKPGSNAWKFGGVVECYLREGTTKNGVAVPGGIRVIAPAALLDSDVSVVPVDSILSEKIQKTDDPCIKIDIRYSGGT